MKKLIAITTLSLMSTAYASTLKIAKPLPGYYEPLAEDLEYNQQGRYYLPGAGHYFADHGMKIDPNAFASSQVSSIANKNPLSEYVKILPSYLTYKMLKNYEDIERGKLLSKKANEAIITNPHYNKLKDKFKQGPKEVELGGIFLAPKEIYEAKKANQSGTCDLNHAAILEVKSVGDDKSEVAVGNMLFTSFDIQKHNSCKTGDLVSIKNDDLLLFNLRYVHNAYQRNFFHQEKLKTVLGKNRFVEIESTKYQICSGSKMGRYAALTNEIISNVNSYEIENINTQGSLENLVFTKLGICDYSLVQGDVLENYEDKYNDKAEVDILDRKVYSETGLLVCKKSKEIFTLKDLSANHTISIGEPNSGSNFTYKSILDSIRKLDATNKNLLKVRTMTMPTSESLPKISDPGSEIDCVFMVSDLNAENIKENILGQDRLIRAVQMNLPYDKLSKVYGNKKIKNHPITELTELGSLHTLSIDVKFIRNSNYTKGNVDSAIVKELERMNKEETR